VGMQSLGETKTVIPAIAKVASGDGGTAHGRYHRRGGWRSPLPSTRLVSARPHSKPLQLKQAGRQPSSVGIVDGTSVDRPVLTRPKESRRRVDMKTLVDETVDGGQWRRQATGEKG